MSKNVRYTLKDRLEQIDESIELVFPGVRMSILQTSFCSLLAM